MGRNVRRFDVTVLLPEELTSELLDVLTDAFSYGDPAIARSETPGCCELFLTYQARDMAHAVSIACSTLDGISDPVSVAVSTTG